MWGTLVLISFTEVINVLKRIMSVAVIWASSGSVDEVSYLSCNKKKNLIGKINKWCDKHRESDIISDIEVY